MKKPKMEWTNEEYQRFKRSFSSPAGYDKFVSDVVRELKESETLPPMKKQTVSLDILRSKLSREKGITAALLCNQMRLPVEEVEEALVLLVEEGTVITTEGRVYAGRKVLQYTLA